MHKMTIAVDRATFRGEYNSYLHALTRVAALRTDHLTRTETAIVHRVRKTLKELKPHDKATRSLLQALSP